MIKDVRLQGDQPPGHEPPKSSERMGTTVPIDLQMFTTVSVIQALDHRFAVPSFLRDMFFSAREFVNAENVQLDVRKGPRGLAPFILPLEGQVVGRRAPFVRRIVQAPIIAPARVITLREIGRPFWGETMYNFETPEQRVATMLADDYQDMDEEISRTEEWMCANMMFNGRISWNVRTNTDVGADWRAIDYGFTNITAVATPWTAAGSNPLNDLTLAQQALNANGYAGNIAIYGTKAWNALMNNQTVRETFLWPRFGPVSTTGLPEALPAGVARGPSFTAPIMENYIYSGAYASGTILTNLVPDDKVLICSSDVRHRMVYGMVTQIEQADGAWHSYAMERVPKIESNVNKNFMMQTVTSRPIPLPVDLMSWTILEGVLPATPAPEPPSGE